MTQKTKNKLIGLAVIVALALIAVAVHSTGIMTAQEFLALIASLGG